MKTAEKAGAALAVIVLFFLGLALEMDHVEGGAAWELYVRARDSGREEAASCALLAVMVHRSTQIMLLTLALAVIGAALAVSRRRASPEGTGAPLRADVPVSSRRAPPEG
jgi:hypothetical protein